MRYVLKQCLVEESAQNAMDPSNVSDVNTSDGFAIPPQLPSPYPCNNCDMDSDKMSHANRLTSPSLLFLLQEVTVSFLTSDRSFVIVLACEHVVIEISTV